MKRTFFLSLFLFTVLILSVLPFTISPVRALTENLEIIHSTDDAQQDGTDIIVVGYPDTTGLSIQLRAQTSSSLRRYGGLRFQDVDIPKGSIINDADLQIYVIGSNDDMNTKIYGHDVDDAVNFADDPYIVQRSPRTTAFVSWVADGLGVGWESKNITDIIQEIVDRDGWESGNDLVLLFIVNSDVTKLCYFEAYDDGASNEAQLDITWTENPQETINYEKVDLITGLFYDEYVYFNSTLETTVNSTTDFYNCTLGLDNGIVLKWDNATDVFSEYADPSSYCVINATASNSNVLNDTHIELIFNFKLVSPDPLGFKDIPEASTECYSKADYDNITYSDAFILWNTSDVFSIDSEGFVYSWSNISGETWLNETSSTSYPADSNLKYDNSTMTTRGVPSGTDTTNYATLYVIGHGFVYGWSNTLYDVYRNQTYECIGEAGYQDWNYNGLIEPPSFPASFPTETGVPWYVPLVIRLMGFFVSFGAIAYYWNRAYNVRTGLLVVLVSIISFIVFISAWSLADSVTYWMYQ